jgi:hypothetical protein
MTSTPHTLTTLLHDVRKRDLAATSAGRLLLFVEHGMTYGAGTSPAAPIWANYFGDLGDRNAVTLGFSEVLRLPARIRADSARATGWALSSSDLRVLGEAEVLIARTVSPDVDISEFRTSVRQELLDLLPRLHDALRTLITTSAPTLPAAESIRSRVEDLIRDIRTNPDDLPRDSVELLVNRLKDVLQAVDNVGVTGADGIVMATDAVFAEVARQAKVRKVGQALAVGVVGLMDLVANTLGVVSFVQDQIDQPAPPATSIVVEVGGNDNDVTVQLDRDIER